MAIFKTVRRGFSGSPARGVLSASVSATALIACAIPSLAHAQDADATAATASTDTGDDAIVVTGIRASLESARDRKRDAVQVMDSITAQDIGALPDRSVSEALQRIPGVTLQRTSESRDPARLSGEGGGVFIRGLSFVRSELNGRDVFSANNGRGLSFEDVSSDLLSGVDIYKNPSADLIEGGIGGTINLRTRKPFDAKGFVAAVSGDANYADLRDKTYFSGNALLSDRWDTGIGEIGVLLSYSISNIGNRTDSISAGRYLPAKLGADQDGLSAGDTVYIPNGMGFRRIDWQQKRNAFDGSIQWRPDPTLTLTAEAFISKATPQDLEYAFGDYAQPETDNSSYQFNDNGALEAGVVNNRSINMNTRAGKQKKKTQDFSFNAAWQPDDHWTVSGDVQYIKSTAEVYSMTAYTGTFIPTTIDFDFTGNTPSMLITPTGSGDLTNKSEYWWAAAMDHIEDNDANEWAVRGDVDYQFDDGGFLNSLKFGGRWTKRDATTRQTGYNWGLLSAQYWQTENPVYLDQTGFQGGPQVAGLPDQTTQVTFPDFFRGNTAVPTSGLWYPSAGLVQNGTANAYDYLKATLSSGSGWTPLSGDYSQAAPGSDNVSGGINDQREKTWAVYGLANFGLDDSAIGRFDGNIGLRVVHTDTSAVGSAIRVGTLATTCTPSATVDCADFNTAVSFLEGDLGSQLAEGGSSYTNFLPNFNLRFFLQDNLQLRLAASKAMVRPTFSQLNPFTTLNFSFDPQGQPNGTGVNGAVTAFTGTSGNPALKPTKANQFDASLEYYFGRSNSLTLGLFYKEIKDYIFSGVVEQSYTSNGETVDFAVTQQTNGAKGKVKGFELAYTQFFDFLPGPLSGLGFNGNFTFVDSTGGKNTAVNVFDPTATNNAGLELPLEGLSKYSYNLAGIYEKYGISARVAYNWRSNYLLTTSAANINYPVWSEDYGQVDASVLVSLNDHLKVGLQGTNLLAAKTYLQVGDPSLKPRYSWTSTDRRVAFLVRTSF